MRTTRALLLIACLLLVEHAFSQQRCTPTPDLLRNYVAKVAAEDLQIGAGVPPDESAVLAYIAKRRGEKWPSLKADLYDIAVGSAEYRKNKNEIILWEDDIIMVLVDYRHYKALVIPRSKGVWVITDVDRDIQVGWRQLRRTRRMQ